MKISNLIGRRIKETPKDAETDSHIFLLRGGYIRPVSAGIYSLLPLGKRIINKIENIIREEMNAIDGQEVLMPIVLPRELWEESGRYEGVGPELLRFKDRNEKDMLLGMTHEEAVVHLARSEANSYKQLPFMLYQIQTKYRDEARPRAGLIRVREFTMKDAYSFHESQQDLDKYYEKALKAYERIFKRLGMNDVLTVKADSGMMGGSISHEFMAVSECGEDTLFVSHDNKYKANREIAETSLKYRKEPAKTLEKVYTPGKKSIEEVADFLELKPENTGKAVFYSDLEKNMYFVVIRGDIEVNEGKLKKIIGTNELEFASDEHIREIGAEPGYASPINVHGENVIVIFDHSAAESSNLVVGANEKDYHYKNFNFDRDMNAEDVKVVDIATARNGDPCPVTGEPLVEKRGIEVGNIFQLGTKYTKPMGCTFLDQNGISKDMIMGCYGIGVGRSMAAVVEQSHDKFGPIWPISIAPFQVHICALNINKEGVKEAAEKLYSELTDAGLEVILDDRKEKAGFMFNDADLIGAPHRLVISARNLEEGEVEYRTRASRDKEMLKLENVVEEVEKRVKVDLKKYR